MNILVIDSTSDNLVVCAQKDNKRSFKISKEGSKRHNSLILQYVDIVLSELNITLKDIDYFGCVVGPGSFTGIRIAISTQKAFSYVFNKPSVAINSLEEIAFKHQDKEFYSLIDARHENFYGAKFDSSWKNMVAIGNYTKTQLVETNLPLYVKDSYSNPDSLLDIAIYKIENNMFEELMPLYLKKSSAERERDGE